MNDILADIKNRAFSEKVIPGGTVAAVSYARVSTDKEEQQESCQHQNEDAQFFASLHPNIKLGKPLVDDGISGKNATNRPDFQELVSRIEAGEVEMVIVRSLSRMQRDVETFMMIYNLCANSNVLMYILDKNLTVDPDDKMQFFMLLIEAYQDENYSVNQSNHGRKTHKRRIENKELSSKDSCYGYTWHSKNKELGTLGHLSINEEESEVIRSIFERYTYEQADPTDIADELNKRGITNRYSKTKVFNAGTINTIVQNEKYVGRFYINQRTTVNQRGMNGQSKRVALPKEEWVLIEREDLRIVDQELFDVAQRLRKSRQKIYVTRDKETVRKGFEGSHDFSNKIKCACCGQFFRFDYGDRKRINHPIYRVTHKNCSSTVKRIDEAVVREVVEDSIRNLLDSQQATIQHIEDILCEGMEQVNSNEGEIQKLTKAIASKGKEIEKYSTVLTNDKILSNEGLVNIYLAKIEKAQSDVAELEERREQLAIENDRLEVAEKVNHIRSAIEEFTAVKELSRERILRNVKEITVDVEGNIKLVLTSGLSYVGKYQCPDARSASL